MTVPRWSATLALATASAFVLSGCITVAPSSGEAENSPPPPTTAQPPEAVPEDPVQSDPPVQVAPQPPSIPSDVPPEWTDTVAQVSTGVARISISTCDDVTSAGSGFLVSDTLVATAAHVVEGAATLQVESAGTVSEAEVLGYSQEADLALLRLDEPVGDQVLFWADEPPRVSQEVSALGFPLGAGFASVQGVVSSLDPRVEGFSETARYIQTDAPTNPGNSGGPLITVDGSVIGVVLGGAEYTSEGRPVEGMNFALSYEDARPLIDGWVNSPQPMPPVECPVAPGVPDPAEEVTVDVTVASTHERAAEFAQLLALHGNAINDSQYDVAFDLFTPSLQDRMEGVETWRQGLLSTYWHELAVLDVTGTGDTLTTQTQVRTTQLSENGPDGQTCSVWTLDYTMVRDEQRGTWLIDEVTTPEDPRAC